jgi:hypothetical protein
VASARPAINEQSYCGVRAAHYDEDGLPLQPASLRYRLDDLTNERAILPWTVVNSPTPVNLIQVTALQNSMSSVRLRAREIRRVTLEIVDDSGQPTYHLYEYDVVRLTTVP